MAFMCVPAFIGGRPFAHFQDASLRGTLTARSRPDRKSVDKAKTPPSFSTVAEAQHALGGSSSVGVTRTRCDNGK
jgi:hypothetical protein